MRPDAQNLSFTGTESVTLQVYQPGNALTLNANGLSIASAALVPANGNGAAMNVEATVDSAGQQVRFAAPQSIAPGTYRLDVVYRSLWACFSRARRDDSRRKRR